MCHLMPLKKQKQILGGEKLCSGKMSLVAMVTRTQIAADKCCPSIHILCVSSSDVILFMSCVSLQMLSFYSYSVCLFIMCHSVHILCVSSSCHAIHILCVSSSCVMLFICCVSSSYVVIHSYPVCLFIICCHSFISCVALHHMLSFIHILCGSLSFVILFMSYVSLHICVECYVDFIILLLSSYLICHYITFL